MPRKPGQKYKAEEDRGPKTWGRSQRIMERECVDLLDLDRVLADLPDHELRDAWPALVIDALIESGTIMGGGDLALLSRALTAVARRIDPERTP